MLSASEIFYTAIEKETTAVIQEVRKWRHHLVVRHFTFVTDQNIELRQEKNAQKKE